MSEYQFPAIITDNTLQEQINKIRIELQEAKSAEIRYRCGGKEQSAKEELGMELLDISHAVETALRMVFEDSEVCELRQKVIEKNALRGYYGGVE